MRRVLVAVAVLSLGAVAVSSSAEQPTPASSVIRCDVTTGTVDANTPTNGASVTLTISDILRAS